jgi:hypothetical protein
LTRRRTLPGGQLCVAWRLPPLTPWAPRNLVCFANQIHRRIAGWDGTEAVGAVGGYRRMACPRPAAPMRPGRCGGQAEDGRRA